MNYPADVVANDVGDREQDALALGLTIEDWADDGNGGADSFGEAAARIIDRHAYELGVAFLFNQPYVPGDFREDMEKALHDEVLKNPRWVQDWVSERS